MWNVENYYTDILFSFRWWILAVTLLSQDRNVRRWNVKKTCRRRWNIYGKEEKKYSSRSIDAQDAQYVLHFVGYLDWKHGYLFHDCFACLSIFVHLFEGSAAKCVGTLRRAALIIMTWKWNTYHLGEMDKKELRGL